MCAYRNVVITIKHRDKKLESGGRRPPGGPRAGPCAGHARTAGPLPRSPQPPLRAALEAANLPGEGHEQGCLLLGTRAVFPSSTPSAGVQIRSERSTRLGPSPLHPGTWVCDTLMHAWDWGCGGDCCVTSHRAPPCPHGALPWA